MKRILINIPDISKNDGGVYQYSLALINLVSRELQDFEFFIFCNYPEADIKKLVDTHSHISLVKIENSNNSNIGKLQAKILNLIYKTTGFSRKVSKKDIYDQMIEKYDIDIIHTPFQYLVKKPGVRSITTLHDVQELHFPEFFTSAQRAYRAVYYKKYIDDSDAVVVSYNHIKEDLKKFFDKPSEKIHVILLDMINLWFNQVNSASNKISQKFDLPRKYLLYPASTWEHKNHLRLLKAIKDIQFEDIFLICTGNRTEYFQRVILPFINEKNLNDKVKFLGVVSDEDLFSLYKESRAVVIPTLYEAGSFPLMESILMNIPVICSNVTSLPETLGNDEFLFDPYNISEMKDRIEKIWEDRDYRKRNMYLLKNQAGHLRNNNAGIKIRRLYENLFSHT